MIDFTSLNSFRGKDLKFQLKEHDFLVSPCVRTRHLVTQGSGLGRRSLDQGFWRYAQANEIRTMSLGWLKKTHILNSAAMSLGELGFFTRGTWFGGSCVKKNGFGNLIWEVTAFHGQAVFSSLQFFKFNGLISDSSFNGFVPWTQIDA